MALKIISKTQIVPVLDDEGNPTGQTKDIGGKVIPVGMTTDITEGYIRIGVVADPNGKVLQIDTKTYQNRAAYLLDENAQLEFKNLSKSRRFHLNEEQQYSFYENAVLYVHDLWKALLESENNFTVEIVDLA